MIQNKKNRKYFGTSSAYKKFSQDWNATTKNIKSGMKKEKR